MSAKEMPVDWRGMVKQITALITFIFKILTLIYLVLLAILHKLIQWGSGKHYSEVIPV